MEINGVDVRWSPRLRPEKLRRLYEQESRELTDETLLDDVAFALYARCRSVVTVTGLGQGGTMPCFRCQSDMKREATLLICSGCRWQATTAQLHKTWEQQQLNGTSAINAFRAYLAALPVARSAQEKMLAIDRLIHAYHVALRLNRQNRPVAANLIEGSSRAARELLDSLAR